MPAWPWSEAEWRGVFPYYRGREATRERRHEEGAQRKRTNKKEDEESISERSRHTPQGTERQEVTGGIIEGRGGRAEGKTHNQGLRGVALRGEQI